MMEAGKWDANGAAIKIAKDGTLLDGQHRLTAIVQSGKSVVTLVVTGLEKEVFTTIDAGKTRSHGDYLKIAGHDGNHSMLAASARIAMLFDKTGKIKETKGHRLSPDDVVIYVDKHPGIIESMGKLQQKLGKILPCSIAIGCHYIFSIVDMEKADEFFNLLSSGEYLYEGHPILTLRNRLLSLRGGGRAGEGHRRMLLYYVVHTFNAFMDGKTMKNIPYKTEFDIFLKGFEESCLSNW